MSIGMPLIGFKDRGKRSADLGYIDRKGDWLVPIFALMKISLSVAVGTIMNAAASIGINFKSVKTLTTVFSLKELEASFIDNTAPWKGVCITSKKIVKNFVVKCVSIL
jgi:hypothetical protein